MNHTKEVGPKAAVNSSVHINIFPVGNICIFDISKQCISCDVQCNQSTTTRYFSFQEVITFYYERLQGQSLKSTETSKKAGCSVAQLLRRFSKVFIHIWNGIIPSRRTNLNCILISSRQHFCRLVADSYLKNDAILFSTLSLFTKGS